MPGSNDCYDYARGVCTRGESCRFDHVGDVPQAKERLPVCKDYQGVRGCPRTSCRYLHLTVAEEDEHLKSGELPPHKGDARKVSSMQGGSMRRSSFPEGPFDPRNAKGVPPGGPFCRDFINGHCSRGRECRYRHVTQRELDLERQMDFMLNAMPQDRGMQGGGGGRRSMERGGGFDTSGSKRRRPADTDETDGEKRIEELEKKVIDLKRQVVDLREINDQLYDQNDRFRKQLRSRQADADLGLTASATTGKTTGYERF